MITIGIDPDLTKSGVAFIKNGVVVDMCKLSLPDLYEMIKTQMVSVEPEFKVIMEDPEVNKPIFKRKNVSISANLKIAQNVGQVKAAARLIAEMIESLGVTCHKVAPLKGMVKKAKTDAKFFNELTGWDKRSNEDCRDAALIAVFGK